MIRTTTLSYVPFLFPILLLMKTLLRLMNQANPNSDGPVAISARLSTTHTIKQPDHLIKTYFSCNHEYYCTFLREQQKRSLLLPLPPSRTSWTPVTSTVLRAEFSTPRFLGMLLIAGCPPPILPECNANCMGSLPMMFTINLNTATASVLAKTFHPSGVLLTVKGSSAGSSGYTSSSSKRASDAPIDAPPSPSPARGTFAWWCTLPFYGHTSTPETVPAPL